MQTTMLLFYSFAFAAQRYMYTTDTWHILSVHIIISVFYTYNYMAYTQLNTYVHVLNIYSEMWRRIDQSGLEQTLKKVAPVKAEFKIISR